MIDMDIAVGGYQFEHTFILFPYVGFQWGNEWSQMDFGWLCWGGMILSDWSGEGEGEDE